MFSNLTNLGYKRTGLQALGFYLAYLLLAILSAIIIGGLFGAVSGNTDLKSGVSIGVIFALLYCLILGFLILRKKNLTSNYSYILLVVLSGVLGYLGGGVLGLIPLAYLTTK